MGYLSDELSSWYKGNKRELPWRNTQNPYHIWLSEIILQQTRVAQGLPYFLAFVESFPTVYDLADASEDQVLRLWQGLGYYSRARNLHFTAKMVVNNYGGDFPKTYLELQKLKGVGEYTAAAIASFAFKEKVAVLDGNVFRVIARYFGVELDIAQLANKKTFLDILAQEIPEKNSDIFNQAIMEFGALQCVPQNPNCLQCPLQNKCYAFAQKKVGDLPLKLGKIKKRDRFFNYLILMHEGKIAMQKRKPKDIWEGLYEFVLMEDSRLLGPEIASKLVLKNSTIKQQFEPNAKHLLSHQTIYSQMTSLETNGDTDDTFYSLEEIAQLPKPKLIENFLAKNIYKNR